MKKIIYIREMNKASSLKNKLLLNFRKIFNIIKTKDNIYYLPIYKEDKFSEHKIKRLTKKINMLLERDASNTVALSIYLDKNQLLKNYLYSQNVNILDGRFLFKCLSYKLIEYILHIKNKEMEFEEVSMLINDFTDINKDLIIDIAKKIKRLNIVTNNINKCKRIEEYLYDEFGIMLNISNNKRRSLLKSELIINIDFPEELINKYTIYDKAIILNINDKINIKSKRFNGININYYKAVIPDNYKLEDFADEILYESLICVDTSYKSIIEKIKKDKIRIKELIGNNGIINKNEII